MTNRVNRAPIVWVVEQAANDYSPALVFGSKIQVIQADRLTPNAVDPSWQSKVIQQMRRAFADYIPGHDFVVPTGQPARMMLAALVMRERGDVHNILGWVARDQRYVCYTLDMRAPDVHYRPGAQLDNSNRSVDEILGTPSRRNRRG